MGLSHIIPAGIDIYQSSYCTIYNVVEMEITYDHGFTSVLITDSNGKIYDCGAFLVEEDEIVDNASYPGTAIYAKHSGLLLRYYPSEDGTISK